MSKERLEEINNFSSLPLKKRISLTKESIKKELKANDYHMPKNININTQYLLEIIKQAERVQELEEDIKEWEIVNESWEEINTQIVEQNKRYQETLEFYADRNNYLPEHLDPETDEKWSKIDYDEGFNARKTLEKECTNGRYRQTNFR